jgi:hypothetical protein
MILYAYQNQITKEFFQNDRGHTTFSTPNAATNAFNYKVKLGYYPNSLKNEHIKDNWKPVKVRLEVVE